MPWGSPVALRDAMDIMAVRFMVFSNRSKIHCKGWSLHAFPRLPREKFVAKKSKPMDQRGKGCGAGSP
jgi:hypothetical protein